MSTSYAALILGSGQGGTPLAVALAKSGQRTALVEEAHIGGTCVNEGCTPTKTMIASARVAYLTGRGKDYGVEIDKPFVMNMETVRRRKRGIIDSFRGGSVGRIKKAENLDLYMGKAKFVGEKHLEVTMSESGEKKHITAERIFINTGGFPAPLSVPGVEQVEILNSTSIMELNVVPDHLVVIGGGYIGLEFAQMFHRFGAKLTVVQRGRSLLGPEDADIADEMHKLLVEDGIDIMLNSNARSVSRVSDGSLDLVITTVGSAEDKTVNASHLLAAAGRTPSTQYLNPSAAGIETYGPGYIRTNDSLETNVPGIYAIGDVKGGPAFTHISYDDFRVLRDNLLESRSPPASIKDRLIPYTVFTDPQLGRIGLTETQARAKGLDIQVAKMPMAYVARALETDESRGR